ncbi:AAA family ATPase [Psychromonas algicola]|uniref:AAA family ATPase n=1 Tax=Psychromonas algicola TaxID=2555642 RepID=UPI00106854BE|nr:AAA family ATPase [Psychromonas sp. RZ5]TEW52370.1 VWA domain-containing protein [Psychromonas sp. RZ5]
MNQQAQEKSIFPFSAVQGQPLFKLALLLATVNPLIGGVLISGPRGCAKSTLARAVADLLPIKENVTPQFVSLPLGASEEMLIGTLDLDHVLKDKSLKFSAGLLKKAHQGVLYVDEVNLLPDHLVDQLLDVASSGVNIVERDGISHSHDARFTLIGTMNPDEGELRPQLQDRFGLMVELDNIYSLEERINIIKARQSFDQDKIAFCDNYQAEQILLQQQINDAQTLLPKVTCDDSCFIDIATRCQQANVDGLRADIMMHRASVTHAAWCGRRTVTLEDIEQVAPLVLLHRMQSGGTPPSSGSNNDSSSDQQSAKDQSAKHGFSRPQAPQNNASSPQQQSSQQQTDHNQQETESGEWGAMPAQSGEAQKTDLQSKANLPQLVSTLKSDALSKAFKPKKISEEYNKNKQGVTSKGNRKSALTSTKPDWFNTLANSLGQWPPVQLAFKKVSTGEQKLHLILLDTSASTLTDSLSSIAKAVVMNITDGAYLQRDKISLLGFGNDNVETIIKAGRAPKKVVNLLDNINAMGGTPLRLILEKAAQSIKQLSQKYPGLSLFCYLITDGRSRVDIDDLKLNVPTLLIDIEKAQIKRGRGKLLAEQLDAEYVEVANLV